VAAGAASASRAIVVCIYPLKSKGKVHTISSAHADQAEEIAPEVIAVTAENGAGLLRAKAPPIRVEMAHNPEKRELKRAFRAADEGCRMSSG
jgi:hypothetical protein